MPDQPIARRAHYMMGVIEALRSLGGSASPQAVYAWLTTNGWANDDDRTTELKTGGTRFEKEVRFARMMLYRAGLVDMPERGLWILTRAGQAIQLTPDLTSELLKALHAVKRGDLSAERTYNAILSAARAGVFISYGALAEASGVPWIKARRALPQLLGRLSFLAHVRGWPMLSAIVVNKEEVDRGGMGDSALNGFLGAAREIGLDPGDDPSAFVRAQQKLIFEWASTAPDRMGIQGGGNEDDQEAEEQEVQGQPQGFANLSEAWPDVIGANRQPRFWFGGAAWGDADQSQRFLDEKIWQNGYQDQFSDQVKQISPGDRIAIKAAFVQKLNLPFDVGGAKVSVMRIKATGVVVENLGDGKTVRVNWDPPEAPRDWYFYTFLRTLHEADPELDQARKLIEFTFGREKQDYDWWLQRPYFARKYSRRSIPEVGIEPVAGESESANERATLPGYTTSNLVAEGCFLSVGELDVIVERLKSKKNLVLQGPPGTGKTWLAKRLAYVLLGGSDRNVQGLRMRVVQFHPSLAYEDFVRGWRPVNGALELADGVFLQAIDAALSEPDQPFVLVIEEINRGNPAQILGEMLTLLEDSKRRPEESLELAYPRIAGERIHIPENLYVIGTMNVADRSIALVDLALRRRFAFVSLEPRLGEAWRNWCRTIAGLDDSLLDLISDRLGTLNETICKDRGLGPHFRIGHSFVTPNGAVPRGDGRAWFRSVVETEILPLLDEYWYDQTDKVAAAREDLLSGTS